MEDFIPTRGSERIKNAQKFHEIVCFESHKKSEKPKDHIKKEKAKPRVIKDEYDSDEDMEDSKPVDEKRKQELEMKKFRYDVIKFGMSGFEKHKARQAKIALAISLGAKPPKNRRKNYKKVIQQKKKEKLQEAKKEKFASGFNSSQLLMKNKKKDKSKSQNNKKKDSSGILGVYGKVTKDKDFKNKNDKKRKRKG